MRIEAVKVENGFLIPFVDGLKTVRRNRILLDLTVIEQGEDEIDQFLTAIRQTCEVKTMGCATIEQALVIGETYRYAYFDSLIMASALEQHCRILYSEDLQHGQVIEKTLTIQNPFLTP